MTEEISGYIVWPDDIFHIDSNPMAPTPILELDQPLPKKVMLDNVFKAQDDQWDITVLQSLQLSALESLSEILVNSVKKMDLVHEDQCWKHPGLFEIKNFLHSNLNKGLLTDMFHLLFKSNKKEMEGEPHQNSYFRSSSLCGVPIVFTFATWSLFVSDPRSLEAFPCFTVPGSDELELARLYLDYALDQNVTNLKYLEVHQNWTHLGRVLDLNPGLECVNVKCPIRTDLLLLLSEHMKAMRLITNKFTETHLVTGIKKLLESQSGKLEKLVLRNLQIHEGRSELVEETFALLNNCPSLKCLELDDSWRLEKPLDTPLKNITEVKISHKFGKNWQSIHHMTDSCPNLIQVDIFGYFIWDLEQTEDFSNLLHLARDIFVVFVIGSNPEPIRYEDIFSLCVGVREISFQNGALRTNGNAALLYQNITPNPMLKLEKIYMRDLEMDWSFEGFTSFLVQSPNLVHLNLWINTISEFDSEHFQELLKKKIICQKLKIFDVSLAKDHCCGYLGGTELLTSILECIPHLEKIPHPIHWCNIETGRDLLSVINVTKQFQFKLKVWTKDL